MKVFFWISERQQLQFEVEICDCEVLFDSIYLIKREDQTTHEPFLHMSVWAGRC